MSVEAEGDDAAEISTERTYNRVHSADFTAAVVCKR